MADTIPSHEFITNIDVKVLWEWFISLPILPKLIALIGPFAALVALVVNIPKAYSLLKGASIRIRVQRFSLVERVPGLVDFQLDVCIDASHRNVTIEKISLVNQQKFHLQYNEPICLYNEPDENEPTNQASVKLAIPITDFEFTRFTENRFDELFRMKLKESQIEILGLQISEGSFRCLTMAGRLKGKIVDGVNFSVVPLDNWSVLIDFGNRKATAILQPSIIDNTQTRS